MALERVLLEEAGPIEGVVDTGIIAIAHFKNPAQESAINLLSRILRWETKCLMPTSAYLGAYHIMTEYIGVERVAAQIALTRTLETRSPAFYPDASVELTKDALTYANGYRMSHGTDTSSH